MRPSFNRSSICMRPGSHTQLPNNCLRSFFIIVSSFFVFLEVSLFPSILVPLPFSLCTESTGTSYVFPFRMMFFYLVTTGWISDIDIICESSIKIKKSFQ